MGRKFKLPSVTKPRSLFLVKFGLDSLVTLILLVIWYINPPGFKMFENSKISHWFSNPALTDVTVDVTVRHTMIFFWHVIFWSSIATQSVWPAVDPCVNSDKASVDKCIDMSCDENNFCACEGDKDWKVMLSVLLTDAITIGSAMLVMLVLKFAFLRSFMSVGQILSRGLMFAAVVLATRLVLEVGGMLFENEKNLYDILPSEVSAKLRECTQEQSLIDIVATCSDLTTADAPPPVSINNIPRTIGKLIVKRSMMTTVLITFFMLAVLLLKQFVNLIRRQETQKDKEIQTEDSNEKDQPPNDETRKYDDDNLGEEVEEEEAEIDPHLMSASPSLKTAMEKLDDRIDNAKTDREILEAEKEEAEKKGDAENAAEIDKEIREKDEEINKLESEKKKVVADVKELIKDNDFNDPDQVGKISQQLDEKARELEINIPEETDKKKNLGEKLNKNALELDFAKNELEKKQQAKQEADNRFFTMNTESSNIEADKQAVETEIQAINKLPMHERINKRVSLKQKSERLAELQSKSQEIKGNLESAKKSLDVADNELRDSNTNYNKIYSESVKLQSQLTVEEARKNKKDAIKRAKDADKQFQEHELRKKLASEKQLMAQNEIKRLNMELRVAKHPDLQREIRDRMESNKLIAREAKEETLRISAESDKIRANKSEADKLASAAVGAESFSKIHEAAKKKVERQIQKMEKLEMVKSKVASASGAVRDMASRINSNIGKVADMELNKSFSDEAKAKTKRVTNAIISKSFRKKSK